ncbi:hypothetical protein Adt_17186 [Abeliophyllum distichum]|uniref:Uncharacterized protein n=1 Tax=Abeliophyllum distichum TaxID=126358 RepID=A0ABD1TFU0_9LAMI
MLEGIAVCVPSPVGRMPTPVGRGIGESRVPVGEALEKPSPSGRGVGESRVPVGEALEKAESGEALEKSRVPVGEALENAGSQWERQLTSLGSPLNDCVRVGLILGRMRRVSSDMVIRWPQLIIISI